MTTIITPDDEAKRRTLAHRQRVFMEACKAADLKPSEALPVGVGAMAEHEGVDRALAVLVTAIGILDKELHAQIVRARELAAMDVPTPEAGAH